MSVTATTTDSPRLEAVSEWTKEGEENDQTYASVVVSVWAEETAMDAARARRKESRMSGGRRGRGRGERAACKRRG